MRNVYFREIDKTVRNRVLCGQGFLAMCNMPGLDKVVLIDFYSPCNVALFCKDLGVHGTNAISFGDFMGYTSIYRAHYVYQNA